jgi:O-antigen chain-terminating methyltransferase
MTEIATLLTAYASLPAPRQPAWGLEVGHDATQHVYADRVAMIVPLLRALPCDGSLRVLDLGCAQGYFTLAVAHALAARGRKFEIVGIDPSEENIRFCEALAAHHGIRARFVCAPFDAAFLRAQDAEMWDAALAFCVVDTGDKKDSVPAAVSPLPVHARVTLGDRPLAAHAFSRRLASGTALPGGEMQGLYVGSDGLAWVGERWFEFDHVVDRSHVDVPDTFAGQRRFFLGAKTVVKAFCGGGRHGVFNRKELVAEAEVLQSLPREPERYPAMLAQADDGDVVWLAREALPGKLLSEQIVAGSVDRDAAALGLLAELAHLQSLGFHHGDLRCWNCLVDGAAVRLIDFGALVRTSSPLERLALAAVLLEVADGQMGHEQPFYASIHPVAAYPAMWQPLVHYLLGGPQAGFGYAEARRIRAATTEGRSDVVAATSLGLNRELVLAAAQEHCEAFQRLRQHDEMMERALAGMERTHAAALSELSRLSASVRELEQERLDGTAPLRVELKNSQTYAASLKATLDRERSDALVALDAMDAARRVAVDYSDSLKRALDESKRYADSLVKELDTSKRDADSLVKALDVSKRDASAQAAQLTWMRHRFRWLKPLWPRLPEDPKDKE